MPNELPALSVTPAAAPPAPLTMRILVVDDNRDAADSTGELLALYGADVEVRYGGEAALAAVAALAPAAVILDLSMPGMDGLEVATRIRTLTGATGPLLVALTALGDDGTREQTAACGFHLHFTKPVDPAKLLRVLGMHLARGGS